MNAFVENKNSHSHNGDGLPDFIATVGKDWHQKFCSEVVMIVRHTTVMASPGK